MYQNIFLIGLMGSGKTTVGRALAKRLGLKFVDSDHEIEARTGASISLIFEIEGEDSFRKREAETILDLTKQKGIVLATGGGVVIDPENRRHLKENGVVIYLRATTNHILQRTAHDRNRPLLQVSDPRQKIEELALQREPMYQEIADIVIDTGRPNVHAMLESILHQLSQSKETANLGKMAKMRNSNRKKNSQKKNNPASPKQIKTGPGVKKENLIKMEPTS